MDSFQLQTPIGILEIKGDSAGLVSVVFTEKKTVASSQPIPLTLKNVVSQLIEYFENKRTVFDLLLNPQGTNFQKKVWLELQTIPHGKTKSYQDIANQLSNPKVIRAAASANGKNPLAIIIPCHRVIGSDGSLTGYAGGLHRKKWLLAHESDVIQGELF